MAEASFLPGGGRRTGGATHRPGVEAVAVAVPAGAVLLATATLLPGPTGAGAGILAVALVAVAALGAVAVPVSAVVLLLVAGYLRVLVPVPQLPVEPFALVFAGVVATTVLVVLRDGRSAPRLGRVELAMALYLLWNIGSAVTPHELRAANFGVEISAGRFILLGVVVPSTLYFVGRTILTDATQLLRLFWTVVVLTAVSVAVSVSQMTGGPAWTRFDDSPDTTWVGRAVGVFNQPVVNGMTLVIGFVVALYLASRAGAPLWQRLCCYLVAGGAVVGVYLTLTRMAWLVLALALVLGACFARGFRAGFVVVLGAIAGVVALRWSTFTSADRYSGGVASSNEIYDRLNNAATALWAIGQKPVAGWGIGRFGEVNTYYHQQWSVNVPWRRGLGFGSHENELGIAAELGLVGLALWLAVLVLLAHRLLLAYRAVRTADADQRGMVLVVVISFAVWFGTGLSSDLRYFDFANALVMLMLGAAARLADRGVAAPPGASAAPVARTAAARLVGVG